MSAQDLQSDAFIRILIKTPELLKGAPVPCERFQNKKKPYHLKMISDEIALPHPDAPVGPDVILMSVYFLRAAATWMD